MMIPAYNKIPFDVSKLGSFPIMSLDVETTGIHWYRDSVFGIAMGALDPDTHTMMSGYVDVRDNPRMLEHIKKEAARAKKIVNHNIKFDALMLGESSKILLPVDRMECTSVRAALINEHEQSFGLDALGTKYLGVGKYTDIYAELAEMFGGKPTKEVQMKNLHRAPAHLAGKYATPDVELAMMLWVWQEEEIKRQGLEQVWNLERNLMPVLLDLERRGVRVDVEKTQSALLDTNKLISSSQHKLNKAAGREVNPNSPKQMRELFGAYKADDGTWRTKVGDMILEETEAGNPSIGADALRNLAERGHDMAQLVYQLRKSTKALQFLKDHILGHELNGRVYPNYNQTRGENELGTGTGRFSINDPALQQIPSRDREIASIVRACFIPEDGHDWVCSDWAQFEFRWFAHYTNDARILNVYRNDPDADFHQVVSDMTGIPRKPRFAGDANSKQINLGMVFGMGEGRLAAEMGLPYEVDTRGWLRAGPEAKEVFTKYHGEIPGVRALLDQASSIARSRGYVKTAMGRHIRFPGGQFTHKAGGLIFQGTSADCMKVKMIEMHKISKEVGFDMLLSVHDEQDFSVPKDLTPRATEVIRDCVENFNEGQCEIVCRVPIKSSIGVGPNWWVASKE